MTCESGHERLVATSLVTLSLDSKGLKKELGWKLLSTTVASAWWYLIPPFVLAFGGRRGCASAHRATILISKLIHDRRSPEKYIAKVNVSFVWTWIVFLHPFKDYEPESVFHLFVTISRFPKR